MTNSKICPKCRIEKPLTLEYWYKNPFGRFYSSCKDCCRLYQKNTRGIKARQNPLEARAEKTLNKLGIPTDKHDTNSWDIRVWGCIYVEVKPLSGGAMIHFTPNQIKRNRDNVILMIEDNKDWYIIPMRDAPIENRTFCLGKVSEHGNAHRRKEFVKYRNAFYVIEAERARQSRKLKDLHDRTPNP